MVKIMVPNPMNKWDDLEVPLFLETPIYTQAAANGSFWKKHTRKQQLQRVVLLFLLFGWGKCFFFYILFLRIYVNIVWDTPVPSGIAVASEGL